MTAQLQCEKNGLTLASVRSKEEAIQLFQQLRKIENADTVISIGGYNYQKDAQWRWVANGHLIDYVYWSLGEPNQKIKEENCIVMQMSMQGMWNDDECFKEFYYICEHSPKKC
ncbi:hypothetical protein DMENIID0001_168640 [Sergentomyia squamirostris]